MEELNVIDFLSVFRRRKKLFSIVFISVFMLSFVAAVRWSNYRSVATVEVALPEVAQEATSAGENIAAAQEQAADFRISYLQQKVLSTGSLVEIITKLDLYPALRKSRPIANIADKMRNKVKLNMVEANLSGKAAMRQSLAIAFTLSFDYSQPLLAQQVTNELVSRFLDEDIKQRRNQAKETTAFLNSQLKVLEESLAEQEKKIAEFRASYTETQPEALAFNQQAMTSMLMTVQGIDSQISSNLGTQGALRAQLASIDPYSRIMSEGQVLTTPSIQLRALKSEYATLTAKYGPDHPDVQKVARQIGAMKKQKAVGSSLGVVHALLIDAQTKLDSLKKTYGDENPEIKTLKTQIEKYKMQLKEENDTAFNIEGIKEDADNPAYLQVVAQLRAAKEQGAALAAQKASLMQEMEKHQKAVAENPGVQQKLAGLTRDYENAQLRYRELTSKKLQSEMNEAVEQDRVGQRLVIMNPPELPLKTQPSRLVFILGGFILAIFAGVASVVGAQLIRPAILGAQHLEAIVGVAPLIVIPHIVNQDEKIRITKQQTRIALAVLGGLVLVLIIFSYAVMPLDVLVSVLSLKLGLG